MVTAEDVRRVIIEAMNREKGLTYYRIAANSGLDHSVISRFIHKKDRKGMHLTTALKLFHALDIPFGVLDEIRKAKNESANEELKTTPIPSSGEDLQLCPGRGSGSRAE